MDTRKPFTAKLALMANALFALTNGSLYSWSAFVIPIEQSTGLGRSETALVFSSLLLFFSIGMILCGAIMHRIGARPTVGLGSLLLASGLALSSQSTELWQFILSYGFCGGMGIGLSNIIPRSASLSWYPNKSGLIFGVMTFVLALGTLLFGSILAVRLIPVIGWENTMFTLAGIVIVLSCIGLPFVRFAQRKSRSASKADDDSLTPKQVLKTRGFRRVWLWGVFLQASGLMVIGHIVPYAIEQGVSAAQAGAAMGAYAIVNGFGRLFFGILFDRKGFRFSMMLDTLCMGTGMLLLVFLPPVMGFSGLIISVAFIALSYGGSIPQGGAYVIRYGRAHLETNLGLIGSMAMAAGFAGPYIGGFLHSAAGSYMPALLAGAAMTIPSALFLLAAPDDRS